MKESWEKEGGVTSQTQWKQDVICFAEKKRPPHGIDKKYALI